MYYTLMNLFTFPGNKINNKIIMNKTGKKLELSLLWSKNNVTNGSLEIHFASPQVFKVWFMLVQNF